MILDLVTTLRVGIEDGCDTVKYVFAQKDGLSLADDLKPFATVSYEFDNRTLLSAGRRSKDVTYTFRIGVFAESYVDLLRMSEEVSTVLSNQEGIVLIRSDGSSNGQSIHFDVTEFIPMYNDSQEDKTNNNRGYFTVSARLLTSEGEAEFTQ